MGWTFTVIPGGHAFMIPLLVILHIFTGIAVAGITLTVGTLSFKLAPHGRATPYLTGASLADSAGTGLGALAGGFLADLLAGQTFALNLSWASPFQSIGIDSIQLTGYHLLFALAFIIGLINLRTLRAVHEAGSARREAVLPELMANICTLFYRFNLTLDKTSLRIFPFRCLQTVTVTDRKIGSAIHRLNNADRRAALTVSTVIRGLDRKPPS